MCMKYSQWQLDSISLFTDHETIAMEEVGDSWNYSPTSPTSTRMRVFSVDNNESFARMDCQQLSPLSRDHSNHLSICTDFQYHSVEGHDCPSFDRMETQHSWDSRNSFHYDDDLPQI